MNFKKYGLQSKPLDQMTRGEALKEIDLLHDVMRYKPNELGTVGLAECERYGTDLIEQHRKLVMDDDLYRLKQCRKQAQQQVELDTDIVFWAEEHLANRPLERMMTADLFFELALYELLASYDRFPEGNVYKGKIKKQLVVRKEIGEKLND
jgi:hypothetical protein